MTKRFDFGSVNMRADDEGSQVRPRSEPPFCIAIMGDFSGRASRGISEPEKVGERKGRLIDRDNFDEVMAKLKVELHLSSGGDAPLVFRFSDLDDFHPDHLLENEAFQPLKQLREQLEDPARFAAVAEQVGLLRPHSSASAKSVENAARPLPLPPNPARLASSSLLDEMIEETESRAPETSRRTDEIHDFARLLSAKYAVSAPDARQPEVIGTVDRAIGNAMRALLHYPQFQALEAIWRATFLLSRRLDTGSQLKLYVFDISKDELVDDLRSEDIRKTGLYRLLAEKGIQTAGAEAWSLVVADYRFGTEEEETKRLGQLARIAHAAGAVVVTEARPAVLGCRSLVETPHPRDWKPAETPSWAGLRRLPEATALAMALPRFLLRLPYGKETSPVELIEFEEFPAQPVHEDYLWGNPAFVVGLMLGQSFSQAGWDMQPGTVAQLDDLPLHVYGGPGESETKPCAEVLLTDEAVERILDQGLIPLISYKGRDSVRVGRFQPVADGRRPLAARWEKAETV